MRQASSIPQPLVRVNQWCIVVSVALAWTTGTYAWLLPPLLAGLAGLLFGVNPIMSLARPFLRKPLSEYAMEDRGQQQFNQLIAVACLALGLAAYAAHWMIAAYAFTAIVALAAFIAILGFCVGCFLRYQWSQHRHRRSRRSRAAS
ncbi:MAG: DUF4395 domain-containing protein [Bacilli bacterium]